jgi:hypothetical protein
MREGNVPIQVAGFPAIISIAAVCDMGDSGFASLRNIKEDNGATNASAHRDLDLHCGHDYSFYR